MRHLPPIHIVVLFAVGACGPAATSISDAQPVNDSFEAEYAVYSAVLDAFAQPPGTREVSFGGYVDVIYGDADLRAHMVSERIHSGKVIFGLEQEDLVLRAMDSTLALSTDLIANYTAANETGRRLNADRFITGTPVRTLSAAEARQISEETMDSTGYPDPFPAPGHVTFSGVGFSADHTEATLTAMFRCGGLCGSVQVLVLEREGDQWQVTRSEVILVF